MGAKITAAKLGGFAAAAFTILVWSVTFVNTRALLSSFSALEIQIIRFTMAWAALSAICLAKGLGKTPVARGDERLFTGMAACGVFIYQFLENSAIHYTNASNVVLLVAFAPVVTAALAHAVLGDGAFSPRFIVGSAIALGGVALVSFSGVKDFGLHPLGDAMAVAAMCSWGCYSMLMDKVNAKGYPQILVMRKVFARAVLMMIPVALFGMTGAGSTALKGSFAVTLDRAANAVRFGSAVNWLNLGFLGLFASALCFILWNAACKSLGTVKTTIGLYFMPLAGVIFAALILGESLTPAMIVGGVLTSCGVIYATPRKE